MINAFEKIREFYAHRLFTPFIKQEWARMMLEGDRLAAAAALTDPHLVWC